MIQRLKKSTNLLLLTMALVACGGGKETPVIGELQVSVMFMKDFTITAEKASMVMAYAWDSAGWNHGNPGTPVSSSNDGMFMDISLSITEDDIMKNGTHALALKGIPAGEYYVGVFATQYMNYSAESTSLIGYYNSNDSNTNRTLNPSEATPLAIIDSTPIKLKTMMFMPTMKMGM